MNWWVSSISLERTMESNSALAFKLSNILMKLFVPYKYPYLPITSMCKIIINNIVFPLFRFAWHLFFFFFFSSTQSFSFFSFFYLSKDTHLWTRPQHLRGVSWRGRNQSSLLPLGPHYRPSTCPHTTTATSYSWMWRLASFSLLIIIIKHERRKRKVKRKQKKKKPQPMKK